MKEVSARNNGNMKDSDQWSLTKDTSQGKNHLIGSWRLEILLDDKLRNCKNKEWTTPGWIK